MSWSDPNSPWSRKQRHREMQLWFGLAALAIAAVFVLVAMYRSVQVSDSVTMISVVASAVPVAALFVGGFFLLRSISRHRRAIEAVEEHDAHVCPLCIEPMDRDDDALICPVCKRASSATELAAYWNMYVMDPARAAHGRRSYRDQNRVAALQNISKAKLFLARRPWRAAGAVGGLWLVLGMGMAALVGVPLHMTVAQYIPVACIVGGAVLLGFGDMKRWGARRYCAKCEYQLNPQGESASRCPECGLNWSQPGGVVLGEPVRTAKHRISGGLIMIAGFGLMFATFSWNWQMRILPTSMLIGQIIEDEHGASQEWRELNARSLSDEQSLKLFEGLLNKQARDAYMPVDARTFMRNQVNAGSVPPSLVDRYYDQQVDAWLVSDERSVSRQPVSVRVECDADFAWPGADVPYLVHSRFRVDGQPIGARLSNDVLRINLRNEDKIRFEFLPVGPGEFEIAVDVWIFYLPGNVNSYRYIDWDENNEPVFPENVIWSTKRTLSRTITITR